MQRRAGHVIEKKDFLLLEIGKGAFGDLGKEDDGHPPRGGTDTGADDQLQVHAAGHHEKTDENSAQDRFPVKPLLKVRGGF